LHLRLTRNPRPLARKAFCVLAALCVGTTNQFGLAASAAGQESLVLSAMRKELDRSFSKLKRAGDAPLYFLSYSVYDVEQTIVRADYGGIERYGQDDHTRTLDVDLRVGSPRMDNTHKLRGNTFDFESMLPNVFDQVQFPLDNDEAAIRTALWLATDSAFKSAQKKYQKVKANEDVKVEAEDTSDDFSAEKPTQTSQEAPSLAIDRADWEAKIKRLSLIYKQYPAVEGSNLEFNASLTHRYLVNSEGTNIEDIHPHYSVSTSASTTAKDGMRLWLYDSAEVNSVSDLPDDSALEKMVRKLGDELTALRSAPKAEPYAGPAILRPKAAGVFFHETFGHRIEGHRQKDEDEGRTFAKKLGKQVMPEFITVVDDPTLEKLGSKSLNGHYEFDDEGVPSQKVVLVENGTLKNYLMGRSPIKNFSKSNGHGRCSPGRSPSARQGNLIVESSKRVPYDKLRELLIEDVKKQGKPYGLIFDEIAGGFTETSTFMPQAFKLLPLRVWRVYADGRPDELLRGVDLVGTPLVSLEKIECAGDDDDTFNGTCGAESGWVPVSASSPSLLVGTIEVELQHKAQDKPPLLPAPLREKDNAAKSDSNLEAKAKP
jgi:TldD protein